MKKIRKKADALFLSLVIALCGGAFLQSCGSGSGAILVTIADLFTVTDVINGMITSCEGQSGGCSGDLTDGLVYQLQVATGVGTEGSTDFIVTIDHSDTDIPAITHPAATNATQLEIAAALVTAIDAYSAVNATDQVSEGFFTIAPTDSHDLFSVANSTESTLGGLGTFGGDPVMTSGADLFAILNLLGNVATPEGNDLLDEADTAGDIPDVPAGATRRVTLTAAQEVPCSGGNGAITTTTTFTGTIDEDELLIDPGTTAGAQPPQILASTIRLVDCEITGGLLNNGGADETLTISGTITMLESDVESLDGATVVRDFTFTARTPVALSIDADDGASGTFWTDLLDLEISGEFIYEDEVPDSAALNGGVCFGAQVDLGGAGADDPDDDEDDVCAAGGDRFLEASSVAWLFDE